MLCEFPIPSGWVFVAYRAVRPDEHFFRDGVVQKWKAIVASSNEHLVVRRTWRPPSFLQAGWIAQDKNTSWYWYESPPSVGDGRWLPNKSGGLCRLDFLIWERPALVPWDVSLLEITKV